ncbi:MAG: UbiA prenyltransferase family protein, partial [Candidatus Aenigmarchaeota archaeon]|nr:UbiA prenyltransferase family protein [Candidatus Aenigmarchaeota archaeon]
MKIKDFIFFIRPQGWKAYMLMGILGILVSRYIPNVSMIIYFLFSLFSYLSFSFAINNYFDIEEDKHEKHTKNPLAKGKISYKEAKLIILLSIIASILFTALINENAVWYMIIMLLVSAMYSSKPIKLKGRFLLDIVSHSLFFGVMIFLYPFVVFDTGIDKIAILTSLLIAYVSINLELRNHYTDYDHDKKAGLKTTVVVLGKEKTEKIIIAMNILYPIIYLSILAYNFGFSKIFLPVIISIVYIISVIFYKKMFRLFDIFANITFLI